MTRLRKNYPLPPLGVRTFFREKEASFILFSPRFPLPRVHRGGVFEDGARSYVEGLAASLPQMRESFLCFFVIITPPISCVGRIWPFFVFPSSEIFFFSKKLSSAFPFNL